MSINLRNIAILNIEGVDYCYIICVISKSEAINLMQNTNLTKQAEDYKSQKYIFIYENCKEILTFEDIKIEKKIYHQKSPIF